jgi:hypothetical protein
VTMSTVIRAPVCADLAGVWPETPWLLEQAARARQAATASTATPREKAALLPGRTPLREQLPSCLGAPPRLVCVIPESSDLTWHMTLLYPDRSTSTVGCKGRDGP